MPQVETFKVDGDYVATFREPAFRFPADPIRLYEEIFRAFSPLLTPEDIRLEPWRQPQDFSVFCATLVGVSIRFRLNNAEVWSNNRKLLSDPSVWSDLISRTLKVVRSMRSEHSNPADPLLRWHSFTLLAHWKLEGETIESFVRRWTPSAPDGMTPSGFVFRSETDQRKITLNVEPSAWQASPENGFVRVLCELPGAVDEAGVCDTANMEMLAALTSIGLDLGLGE